MGDSGSPVCEGCTVYMIISQSTRVVKKRGCQGGDIGSSIHPASLIAWTCGQYTNQDLISVVCRDGAGD